MVPWLNSFANNNKCCPGGIDENISIEGRINEYRKNTKKVPIIIFDYNAVIKLFTTLTAPNACCGGREKFIREKADLFFKTLSNKFACRLIFFLNGPFKDYKIPNYEKRSNTKYDNLKIYFSITDGIQITNENTPSQISLPIYYDSILEIAKKYGEIRIALKNENYLDIAKFTCDNKILALFASDTDFVISKGNYQIWIPDTVNLDKLTINCLNKNIIKEKLKLMENQMPIFATLYGNTIIPSEKVKHLLPSTYQVAISKYIRLNYPNGIQTNEDFQRLTKLLYDNGKNELTMKESRTMIRKSLDFYDISKAEDNTIEPKWLRKHIKITNSRFVYVVLNDIFFSINHNLIHLNMPNTLTPYSQLILQLVLRQMGVILKDFDNCEYIDRKIFYKPNHAELFKIYELKPIFPNFDLPPLQCIVECSNKKYLEHSKKIELLSWLVSPRNKQIESIILHNIYESVYFIPILALNYFVREGSFSIVEADAVLLTISKSIELTVDELENYPEPTNFLARPFYVSNVYTSSIYYFLNALIVSGLFECYKGGHFDGYVFHKIYTDLINANENQRNDMMESIQSYRIYIK